MIHEIDPYNFNEGDESPKFTDFFNTVKILSKSKTSTTVHVKKIEDGKDYVVKIYPNPGDDNLLPTEIIWLEQLNSPVVVKLLEVKKTNTKILAVMEYAEVGSLRDFLKQRRNTKPVSDEEAADLMKGMCNALSYLHKMSVVHRRVNIDHFLIFSKNDLSNVKVTGLNYAVSFDEATQPITNRDLFDELCINADYMPYEFWARQLYNKEGDAWGIGIIVFLSLTSGMHPLYKAGHSMVNYRKILENPHWTFPETLNSLSLDFFLGMLRRDPDDRRTIQQALTHPWISRNFDKTMMKPLNKSNVEKLLIHHFGEDPPRPVAKNFHIKLQPVQCQKEYCLPTISEVASHLAETEKTQPRENTLEAIHGAEVPKIKLKSADLTKKIMKTQFGEIKTDRGRVHSESNRSTSNIRRGSQGAGDMSTLPNIQMKSFDNLRNKNNESGSHSSEPTLKRYPSVDRRLMAKRSGTNQNREIYNGQIPSTSSSTSLKPYSNKIVQIGNFNKILEPGNVFVPILNQMIIKNLEPELNKIGKLASSSTSKIMKLPGIKLKPLNQKEIEQ